MNESRQVRVLFVCMGNICRSPTAHGVFLQRVREAGLEHRIAVDSAGTHGYHVGSEPDQRAQEAARTRGYDLSGIRARRVEGSDLVRFDYVVAMDAENLANLESLADEAAGAELRMLMEYAGYGRDRNVPDPYYGARNGFEEVLDLVEEATAELLGKIRRDHGI